MAVTPPAAGSADPVVQLTTLPGWRQFVAAVALDPEPVRRAGLARAG